MNKDQIVMKSDEAFDDVFITPPTPDAANLEERFGKLEIFRKPLQLIYTNTDNVLAIEDSVLSQISSIDVPLNVVAVCGLYRTGKSYIMNRLANEKTGFALGSTVQSKTKGIWAWCKPHPKQKGQVLLLLDTEGIGDVQKGDSSNDNKMFSLTLLLSSTLIYNNCGVFNQETLDKLAFITELTKNVRVVSKADQSDENENSISIVTPMFIMCLRDFFLELKDEQELEITPDKYFEKCLESKNDSDKEVYNKTRDCIKRYFPQRKCFTMSTPAGSKRLSKLETLGEHELDADFVTDVKLLQAFVYDCEPKVLDAATKKPVDGQAFESFTKTYVKVYENDSALTFEKAFEQASRYHNDTLVKKLVCEFHSDIQELQLPKKTKQSLNEECLRYMNKALKTYRTQAYPYKSEYFEEKAMSKMRAFCNERTEENSAAVQELFFKQLNTMHEDLIQVGKQRYNTKEGFELYRQDLETLELQFLKQMKDYDCDEQTSAIENFKMSIKDEKMKVGFRAKMHEDREKNEKLHKAIQDSLKSHFEGQMEEMKRERIKQMDEELKTFRKNLTERLGVEEVKNQSFFKRLQLLFSS